MRLHHGLLALLSAVLLALVPGLAGCTSFTETAADEDVRAGELGARRARGRADRVDRLQRADPAARSPAQPGSDRDLTFDCGRTEVPINYDEPDGRDAAAVPRPRRDGRADRPHRLAGGQPRRAGRLGRRRRDRPGADAARRGAAAVRLCRLRPPRASACRRPSSASPTSSRRRSSPPSRGRPPTSSSTRRSPSPRRWPTAAPRSTATRWAPSTPSTPPATWTGSARRSATSS